MMNFDNDKMRDLWTAVAFVLLIGVEFVLVRLWFFWSGD